MTGYPSCRKEQRCSPRDAEPECIETVPFDRVANRRTTSTHQLPHGIVSLLWEKNENLVPSGLFCMRPPLFRPRFEFRCIECEPLFSLQFC